MHGQYDSLLTPRGYMQLEDLARRFEDVHIDAVYSSDLFRTRETARAVYERKGLPLILEPRLRELAFGVWEDLPFGDVLARAGESWRLFEFDPWHWSVEGGETFGAVCGRVTEAIADIAAQNDGKSVAVFTHGCAIRILLCEILGVTAPDRLGEVPYVFNTGVTRLRCDGDGIAIAYSGDASHLSATSSVRGGAPRQELPRWVNDTNMRFARETDGGAAVYGALLGTARVGELELDEERGAQNGEGWITRCSLVEQLRGCGLGVQLIGQAVSRYRALGRQKLMLSPADEKSAGFFSHQGFSPSLSSPQSVFERAIDGEEFRLLRL
jgi:probable phosphoglycerate mutase